MNIFKYAMLIPKNVINYQNPFIKNANMESDINDITDYGRKIIQMSLLIQNEYKYNSSFKKYVDQYCDKNGCTVDDAFNNEDIKRMFWRLTEV